jgi:hypothetical protein
MGVPYFMTVVITTNMCVSLVRNILPFSSVKSTPKGLE